jgi:hypothetical protein
MKLTIPGTSRASMPGKPSVTTEEPQVLPKKPSETTKETAAIPKEPQISPGTVNFKWAFVGRIDPEGRNRVVNIADKTSKASSRSFSAGDKLSLYVEPSENTYVYIYLLDSRKNLELIFPTGMDENTLESEFTSGKGTYVPGKYEWFSLDENRGTETFYVLASTERLTRLERLTRNYINAEEEQRDVIRQRVLDEIEGVKRRLVALGSPTEKPLFTAGIIRGIEIDIAKVAAVEVEADDFYSKTIKLNHE